MRIKDFIKSKLIYILLGAFITCVFNYLSSSKLIDKENYYNKLSERQNFVFELSQLLQKRIYSAEVYFWNIESNAREETILDSWQRYKEVILKWNEELPNIYIKLDIYFPKNNYVVSDYSKYLKSKLSFRDFLREEIQLEIIPIHGELVDIKKKIKILELPGTLDAQSFDKLKNKIEKLHIKITNYIDALAEAAIKQNQGRF